MPHFDSFDWKAKAKPPKFRGVDDETNWVLANAWLVSVFWITETAGRAKIMDGLVASGQLELDHSPGYPWSRITKRPKESAG